MDRKTAIITTAKKIEVLKHWFKIEVMKTSPSYDFGEDAKHLERVFQYCWTENVGTGLLDRHRYSGRQNTRH